MPTSKYQMLPDEQDQRYESQPPPEPATGSSESEAINLKPRSEGTWHTISSVQPQENDAPPSLDTRYKASPEKEGNKSGGRTRSFFRLLVSGILRWAITILLMGGFYLAIQLYQNRVISSKSKSTFDAIIVGISIAFGLNIASSLKAIALDLRWWVLGMKKRASEEVDLILHCDSMTDLLRLVFVAPRPRTAAASLFWLSLNMAAQIGIAILGLTYSADPGPEDIYRAPSISNISVANMNSFSSNLGRFQNSRDSSFAAHILGDVGSSYNFSSLPNEPLKDKPWGAYPNAFWNATDHWEYVFLDYAPNLSRPNFLSIYTDRVVASSAVCTTPAWRYNTSGRVAIITADNSNETTIFPEIVFGLELVYYLTTPIELKNQNLSGGNGSCGPGCSNVKVLEPATGPPVPGSITSDDGRLYYYDCNITVVSTSPDQILPPRNGAIAAQAIALSGQIHSELVGQRHGGSNQYVAYAIDVPFGEPQNNSAVGMASLLSRFSIGVIAAAAQTNPPLTVQGTQPMQGVRLQLSSPRTFYLTLGLIGGLQLVLVIVTAILVRDLVIPEEVLMSHEEQIRKRFVS